MKITESKELKLIISKTFNVMFNKINGETIIWGKTIKEDPEYSPYGPIIFDIELSTICHMNCSSCYKSNTTFGKNMSLETCKQILDKILQVPVVTQIAYGIGSLTANSELFDILHYTRDKGVIPNITINGDQLTPELAEKLAMVCGAIAVSNHNKDLCYKAVDLLVRTRDKLNDLGLNPTLKQVNIHQILSEDTIDSCFDLLEDVQNIEELVGLNAVVFLLLKPKGRGKKCNQLKNFKKFKQLTNYALDNNITIGFDSCGCNNFLESIKDRTNYKELSTFVESCESTLQSLYCDVEGNVYPCSFCEGEENWENGINILAHDNFIKDIWFHPRIQEFRKKLLATTKNNSHNCRTCPIFNLNIKDK